MPDLSNVPDWGEIILAALGTLLVTVLGTWMRKRYPDMFSQSVKTVVPTPPVSNGSLQTERAQLSQTLAEGVLRSAEVIEQMLVQSMALNEQYQMRVDELEQEIDDQELVTLEYKKRLEHCDEELRKFTN